MSIHPAVLDALLDAGATAEMIVAAVKADAALDAERVESRRTKDRERQRRHRESRVVTVTRCDTPPNDIDTLTPPDPPYVISNEITPPSENPEIKPEHVVEVWNELAVRHGLSLVKKITPERRKKLLSFIRRHSIDDITEAIAAIPKSPFLLGQNGRGWRASFDWFLEPRNLTKLTEATYVH